MPTPFPGMDPYLEHPQLWPSVHFGLISAIWMDLAPRLSPRYVVAVEERMYLAATAAQSYLGRADVLVAGERLGEATVTYDAPAATALKPPAVKPPPAAAAATPRPVPVRLPMPETVTERYLEVCDAVHGEVITVLELLSPANKRPGSQGQHAYLTKREQLLASFTSLVEIDLLRAGEGPPLAEPAPESDYRILIHRGWEPGRGDLYAIDLRDHLPALPVPLRRGETEPLLDLNTLLHTLYDQAVYTLRIDYTQPPMPPLDEEDAAWMASLPITAPAAPKEGEDA